MKTKLLKKIRKQYTITYYEKQVNIYNTTFKGECMVLRDTVNEYREVIGVEITLPTNSQLFWDYTMPTKEDARIILINKLLAWIEKDYREYRTRKVKQKIETIWYAKK